MKILLFLFFFSSRRRHTRLTCDWSSDVCSSDLQRHQPEKVRRAEGRDADQVDELSQVDVVGLLNNRPPLFGATPQRLSEGEREHRKEQARDRGEVKGGSPTELLSDVRAAGKADRDSNRAASVPDRHHATPLFFGEEVGHERGAGRVIAGLTNTYDRAAEEEVEVAARKSREEGCDAPDGDADADDCLAHAAVAPVAEGECCNCVDEEEGRADQAELGVVEVEFLLYRGRGRGGDPAVHVVEEVDADHDGEDVSGIALRTSPHHWNYEVGLPVRHSRGART